MNLIKITKLLYFVQNRIHIFLTFTSNSFVFLDQDIFLSNLSMVDYNLHLVQLYIKFTFAS